MNENQDLLEYPETEESLFNQILNDERENSTPASLWLSEVPVPSLYF